jgi:hypothetical protein
VLFGQWAAQCEGTRRNETIVVPGHIDLVPLVTIGALLGTHDEPRLSSFELGTERGRRISLGVDIDIVVHGRHHALARIRLVRAVDGRAIDDQIARWAGGVELGRADIQAAGRVEIPNFLVVAIGGGPIKTNC